MAAGKIVLIKGVHGARIDTTRLEEIVTVVHRAAKERRGIFEGDIRKYLPQWNLPSELESDPQEEKTKDPKRAAQFLWVRLYCDRLSVSDFLMKQNLIAWGRKDLNWIYDPLKVTEKRPEDVEKVLREHFKFAIKNKNEPDNGTRFWRNAQRLVKSYSADPRNTINYKTVEEARRHLMEFEGIGTGLANLFIVETYTRGIALPTDPENMKIKIDRHKAGIPIYTDAVTPSNGEIYGDSIVEPLEKIYHDIYTRLGLDPREIDPALWVIGSQVCAQKDSNACALLCPLAKDHCKGRCSIDENTRRYKVLTKEGKRIDTRKGTNQQKLFYA